MGQRLAPDLPRNLPAHVVVPPNMSTTTAQINLMTTGQAADHFGVSVKTIQRWAAAGKLKADRIDGRWFISLNGNDNDTNKPDNDTDKTDEGGLRELLARADSEISHLREQLDRRDKQTESMSQQIDHLSQLLAVAHRSLQQVTEKFQILEDRRRFSFWQRFKTMFAGA